MVEWGCEARGEGCGRVTLIERKFLLTQQKTSFTSKQKWWSTLTEKVQNSGGGVEVHVTVCAS